VHNVASTVDLKPAVGEMLDYVQPENTNGQQKGNEVVVQQKDDKSGQIITEQAVAPADVAKGTPIPEQQSPRLRHRLH
jgi:hypothetical protein